MISASVIEMDCGWARFGWLVRLVNKGGRCLFSTFNSFSFSASEVST